MIKVADSEILKQKLHSIDQRDYGAYQSLLGTYDFHLYSLTIAQIPKDPYAPPHTGIYRIQVQRRDKSIIQLQTESKIQTIACADFLNRSFYEACQQISKGNRGTGFSGLITINQPGQAILQRNCVTIQDEIIEIRCFLGLPAEGRTITAGIAETMLFEELPVIVDMALSAEKINPSELEQHVQTAEDAEFLRQKLAEKGLIALIADESMLPRQSGTSDKPLTGTSAIPFFTPDDLSTEIALPHAGRIKGMGIKKGITLITGGGYHGKSTLLNALEVGIYNHIPGDGREKCVSNVRTYKVRAYSGRSVEKTDLSPFIGNLPFQKDTRAFCTENASGSTSQAASIMETIEMGAEVLLMDEDTCATNFMIRDSKMQQLVDKADEPITTFIDKVRQLYEERDISTVLVMGGIGDYFDVCDQVIQMINYQPFNKTEEARHIAQTFPAKRKIEDTSGYFPLRKRIPVAGSIDPHNQYGKFAIFAREVHRLNFGQQVVDLTDLEQLIELSQTKALGYAIDYATKYMDNETSLSEVVSQVISDIESKGLDILSDRISGHFAWFRGLELGSAINRLRGLQMIQENPEKTEQALNTSHSPGRISYGHGNKN